LLRLLCQTVILGVADLSGCALAGTGGGDGSAEAATIRRIAPAVPARSWPPPRVVRSRHRAACWLNLSPAVMGLK